jgi:hypothetical protein
MLNPKNKDLKKAGKVKKQILIISSLVLIFFIIVALVEAHNNPASSAAIQTQNPGDTDASSSTTAVATATAVADTSTSIAPPASTVNPPVMPEDIGHAVGIAAGGGLSKIPAADLNQQLDEMVALGVTWVRFDIEWGDVQYNSPNSSTWTNYDALVKAINAHHLNALGIILFTPQWARDPSCTGGAKCPPADPAQYATFAAEVAARYKSYGLHYWEIWNEPNNYNFWATKTDCDAYTSLLKATYPAIKKADPDAVVITGGLAPEATDKNNISQTDFLSCVYKDGGENYFDAVGDHSYTFPNLPSSSNSNVWAQMSETSPSLRSIMIANGDANKKIWITEFGTPTDGPDPQWYVSEQKQSDMVTDAMNLYKTYTWAGPIFWYTLKDGGTTTDTIENFFGLLRYDNSQKPAFDTLKGEISAGF